MAAALAALPRRHPHCRAAACALVVDREGSVLLTRRRRHMRTFPSAWVCPGGGLDEGESLEACARREVAEETGIVVDAAATLPSPSSPTSPSSPSSASSARSSSSTSTSLRPLCAWESFFPTSPEDCVAKGTISAQHFLLFFVAAVDDDVRPPVTLQEDETDAFVWVPRRLLRAFNDSAALAALESTDPGAATLVAHELVPPGKGDGSEGEATSAATPPATETATATATATATTRQVEVPLRDLATRYDSSEGEAALGCAEAHLYALREYCRVCCSKEMKEGAQGGLFDEGHLGTRHCSTSAIAS